ncbi:hypothetical protein PIB30_001367 [Stylosanthes scabra]|uniref:Ubiquitin-like protease family profile domain-containing protein n=1 Tax=Stylosanthes scabra TaxID=79078 RepID=A0ABU6XZG5_9FABA|nr:hypothetical protein [Stylosanthes scabra]
MLIPKVETGVASSPAAMLITDVLMSMADDEAPEPHHEEESQPDPSMPSFNLNFDNPTPQADEQTPPKALEMEEEFPLTARTMAVIKSLDEQVSANAPALETPQQIQEEDDDFQEWVATWATVPKGGNDYELIFNLKGPRTLEAMRCQFDSMAPKSYIDIQVVGLMCHILNGEEGERYEKMVYCFPPEILTRMLEAHHHNWIDKKKRRPHENNTLVNHKEYLSFIDREKILSHRFFFAPVLYSEHWWLYVLDKNGPEGPEMFVLDSKNISSPIEERTTLNKFTSHILSQLLRWAGAPTILKKGSWSLLPTYINVPQQPNEYDCAVFVMKWMELIDPTKLHGCCTYDIEQWTDPMLMEFKKKLVAKIILSKDNTKRSDAIRAAHEMRRTKPSATLRSPFLPFSTPDLPST